MFILNQYRFVYSKSLYIRIFLLYMLLQWITSSKLPRTMPTSAAVVSFWYPIVACSDNHLNVAHQLVGFLEMPSRSSRFDGSMRDFYRIVSHYLPCLNLICLIFGATFFWEIRAIQKSTHTSTQAHTQAEITIHSCSGECKSHNTHTYTHTRTSDRIDTWSLCGVTLSLSLSRLGPSSSILFGRNLSHATCRPGFWSNKNCQNVCRTLGKYLHAAQGFTAVLRGRWHHRLCARAGRSESGHRTADSEGLRWTVSGRQ